MKRRDLIRHLEQHGCYLDREGGRHSIYRNPQNGRAVAVPRHREIQEPTDRTIFEQIVLPRPYSTLSFFLSSLSLSLSVLHSSFRIHRFPISKLSVTPGARIRRRAGRALLRCL